MDSLSLDSSLTPSTGAATPSTPRHELVERLLQTPRIPAPQSDESANVPREALEEPVARINETLRERGLEFEISEESSRIITRVIDRETREVIRQIPGEEVLAVIKRFEELQSGLISLEA
ncbi:flagellar protein FlaG [Halomonas sp. HNIBRBA4712]|uniref:flagellar protein FlaG n=1 Tax=Halomonas sp. HNIBRBA4712 TaxID=3373087 RepID=UPI00374642CD